MTIVTMNQQADHGSSLKPQLASYPLSKAENLAPSQMDTGQITISVALKTD